ncbi:MAG: glutathione S-transferase [bacterium]|nr:glutathione S-transferase [bacterium]
MIQIWGRRSAHNVQKVLWALGELSLEHEHIDAGGSAGGLDSREFQTVNPHRRVPVLVDEGHTIWESNSIVRYLAAKYGTGTLWSESPIDRSLADRWMDWELATYQPDFMVLFWGYFRTPKEQRNEHLIESTRKRVEAHLRIVDKHLASHRFLAGDVFSMGDIPIATSLYRYYEMGLETPVLPFLESWFDRLTSRPPYRENVMVSFEELRGRTSF